MTDTIAHQCPECGGTMRLQTITHEERGADGTLYVFENVPAWVCEQCGEIYLDAAVDAKLDEIVERQAPTRTIEAPVYDYANT